MTRKFFPMVTIIVIAAATPWSLNHADAQTSGSSSDTSGATEGQQSSAETGTGTQSATDTQTDAASAAADANSTQSAESPAITDDLFGETPSPADAATQDQSLIAPPTPPTATNTPGTPGTPPATNGQQSTTLNATNADVRLRQQQRDLRAGIQFGQATDRGLTVANLAAGSIFVDSGLRPGDVIVAYDGRPIRNEADFTRVVVFDPGLRVPVTVLRGGRQETIYFTYPDDGMDQQLGQQLDRSDQYQANRPVAPADGPAFLGVGFDTQMSGVAAVRDVLPGSAAEQAGLLEGDVIVALNGQRISSFPQAMQLIGSLRAGDALEIEYTRRMPNRTQATLGARPAVIPGVSSDQPLGESRFYRGGPQDGPQDDQFESETPPLEQDQAFPPPSLPPDNYDQPNELP